MLRNKRERERVEKLVDTVNAATSQESLDLSLGSQSMLDDEAADEVFEALSANKRVKSVHCEKVCISPSSAEKLVRTTFLLHPTMRKLILPLWGSINTRSQKPLMRMQEEFPESVDAHNAIIIKDAFAFSYSKIANAKLSETQLKLVDDIIERKIKPFLVAPLKKLVL